jgi:hypothetical protein
MGREGVLLRGREELPWTIGVGCACVAQCPTDSGR